MVTPTYALTSTLEFYLPGQPETYCLSWNYGMTARPVNQHDLWHPNPRTDPGPFLGRPVVVVEDAMMPPSYSTHLFHKGVVDRIEPIERVEVREHGIVVGAWDITVCHDYRGIAGYQQNLLTTSGRAPGSPGRLCPGATTIMKPSCNTRPLAARSAMPSRAVFPAVRRTTGRQAADGVPVFPRRRSQDAARTLQKG